MCYELFFLKNIRDCLAESSNSFFCNNFIYATRNEFFRVDAALTCVQQDKRLSERPLNSKSTEKYLHKGTGQLTSRFNDD